MREIEIFVRVAERGSFVAAARSLLIDPAAVSRAIAGMEESLGVVLFNRSTRMMKLTPDGVHFYRQAAQLLANFEETIHGFQANVRTARQLRIGMGPALSRRMLLRALPEFQQQHPELQLVLLSINDRAEIGDEGVDILIRPRSTRQSGVQHRQPQGLIVRRLTQSPTVLCASPSYLAKEGTPRRPADLTAHSCLALLTLERDVHDEWLFVKKGLRQKIKFVPTLTAHGDELREAALAGCGIVRLLACHVEDELLNGTLAQVLPDWECLGGLPIIAIYRKSRLRHSPITALSNHLARAFRRYEEVALPLR
jgi:DNA-binding transcriptional LysR family regulator